MLQLRGALSRLLCRNRNGSREEALLHYAARNHHLRHFHGSTTSAPDAASSAPVTPETTTPHPAVDCLVHSYGFSPDEAADVCKRLRRSRAPRNPEDLLSFFKGKGLDEALIRKVVSRRPALLHADVERTLAPKFRALEEMGFTGSDLLKILERNDILLTYSPEKKLIPNISLLREGCGISGQRLLRFLRKSPRLVSRSTGSLKEVIEWVKELGLQPGTVAFDMALHITNTCSRRTVDEKLAFLRSLEWTEEEILSAIRRWPSILGFSQRRTKDSIDFFVQEAGCSASFVAANPVLLTYSIERRVKPRYMVYQILRSEQLPEGDWSLLSLFAVSERRFLDRVIHKYMDRLPHLSAIYGAGSKEQTLINGLGGDA